MEQLKVDIVGLIEEDNLSEMAKDLLTSILREERILNYKGLRLLWFLKNLKSRKFTGLSSVEKREDLDIFHYLLRHGNGKRISTICYLYFEEKIPEEEQAQLLPREMMERLIEAGKRERNECIKEVIWEFLLLRERELQGLISLDELIFGLWSPNPILRNNTIRFLIRHFNLELVIQAINDYKLKTGKRLDAHAMKRFIGLAREELKGERDFLPEILKGIQLPKEEKSRLWSDYLKNLSRFELIEMFSIEGGSPKWIEYLERMSYQMSLNFEEPNGLSCIHQSFYKRIHAIQQQETG